MEHAQRCNGRWRKLAFVIFPHLSASESYKCYSHRIFYNMVREDNSLRVTPIVEVKSILDNTGHSGQLVPLMRTGDHLSIARATGGRVVRAWSRYCETGVLGSREKGNRASRVAPRYYL